LAFGFISSSSSSLSSSSSWRLTKFDTAISRTFWSEPSYVYLPYCAFFVGNGLFYSSHAPPCWLESRFFG
jgi:hypothetical protein